MAAVHGESGNSENNLHALPAAYTYFLDALSDDDDVDTSQIDQVLGFNAYLICHDVFLIFHIRL